MAGAESLLWLINLKSALSFVITILNRHLIRDLDDVGLPGAVLQLVGVDGARRRTVR